MPARRTKIYPDKHVSDEDHNDFAKRYAISKKESKIPFPESWSSEKRDEYRKWCLRQAGKDRNEIKRKHGQRIWRVHNDRIVSQEMHKEFSKIYLKKKGKSGVGLPHSWDEKKKHDYHLWKNRQQNYETQFRCGNVNKEFLSVIMPDNKISPALHEEFTKRYRQNQGGGRQRYPADWTEETKRNYYSWMKRQLNHPERLDGERLQKKKESVRKYYGKDKGRWTSLKQGAKLRGIEVQITKELAFELFRMPCHYCGELSNPEKVHGIDRLDSGGNYTEDNVVTSCALCNRMKVDDSKEVFLKNIESIYNYQTLGIPRQEEGKKARFENIKRRYYQYSNELPRRKNAQKRSFNLDIKHFQELLEGACAYCGTPEARGIDRVDSSIDYEPDNIVSCCFACNQMKRNYEVNHFLTHVSKIYQNSVQKSE